jgi:hypothetical protein
MILDEAEELYLAVQQRNHDTMERLIRKRVWSLRAYNLAVLVNLRDVASRIRSNHPDSAMRRPPSCRRVSAENRP